MKSVIVPAQITSVEDRVTSKLSFSQLILLIIPVFMSGIVFVVVPPNMSFNGFKIITTLMFFVALSILAIRIKDRIILNWLIIIHKFIHREKLYIFNKNDSFLRIKNKNIAHEIPTVYEPEKQIKPLDIKLKEIISYEKLLSNKEYLFTYKTNKYGGLYVSVKKVEETK